MLNNLNDKKMTNNLSNEPIADSNSKGGSTIIIILIAVLILGMGGIGWMYWQQRNETTIALKELSNIKEQNLKLATDIKSLRDSMDIVIFENDSLNELKNTFVSQLESLQEELAIAKRSGNEAKIAEIRKEYEKLKSDYEVLINNFNQLKSENEGLVRDKDNLNTELGTVKKRSNELEDENKNLNDKVVLGSMLTAFSIDATGVKGKKEKEQNKAKKTEKIKISYSIGKNAIAEAGSKTAYIIILAPNDQVIAESGGELEKFTFNGEEKTYSIKQEFQYDNENQDLKIYFKIGDSKNMLSGKYQVEIYTDDTYLGSKDFVLE